MNFPLVYQMHNGENAQAALATMLSYHGRITALTELRPVFPPTRAGISPERLCEMARRYDMDAQWREADLDTLNAKSLPALALWKRKYYCVITSIRHGRVYLADPAKGEYALPLEAFKQKYGGVLVTMVPGPGFKRGGKRVPTSELLAGRLGPFRKQLAFLAMLNLFVVGMNVLLAISTQKMLDFTVGKQLDQGLWKDLVTKVGLDSASAVYYELAVAMCLMLTAATVAGTVKTLLIFRTARRASATSGSNLFKNLLAQPLQFYEQYSLGELIQRLEDNVQLDLTLIRSIVPRVMDVGMTVVYFILMSFYHRTVAFVCILVEVAYVLGVIRLRSRITMDARNIAVSTGSFNATVLNGLDTIETIKAGGMEREFFSVWSESQREFVNNNASGIRTQGKLSLLDSLHSTFSQAALLFAGAFFMIQGSFTLGMMAALQTVLSKFRSSLANCMHMTQSLQRTRTNIERIDDICQRETVPAHPLPKDMEPDKLSGDLVVSHLTYRYNPEEPPVLDDVSFEVKPGELVAFVGRTGCGKSTLLKCLSALYVPGSGEIRYDGFTRDEIPDVVFHASVGTVAQESVMFEDTIEHNLCLWDSTIEGYEMIFAAHEAQIHHRITEESEGYSAMIREKGRNFSGGELQRLELARTLAQEPTLLLLDEFTSALDTLTEEKVFQAIRSRGVSCVIVAHRLSTIRDCDRIFVLDKGRIVQSGRHEELIRQDGLYRTLISAEGV